MRVRAVIFDLWETLIDWNRESADAMISRIAELTDPGFADRWSTSRSRYTGSIRAALAEAGVPPAAMEEVCAIRRASIGADLVPRPGAVETLRELRARGFLVGLITVCSEDVEHLWEASEFAGLFDAEVFSSAVGLSKPDPRIYLHCCELLGARPGECVFVGDGANDELAGALRVGMPAILIHRPGEPPLWPGLDAWKGPRVTSIPDVLEVVELC